MQPKDVVILVLAICAGIFLIALLALALKLRSIKKQAESGEERAAKTPVDAGPFFGNGSRSDPVNAGPAFFKKQDRRFFVPYSRPSSREKSKGGKNSFSSYNQSRPAASKGSAIPHAYRPPSVLAGGERRIVRGERLAQKNGAAQPKHLPPPPIRAS